MLAKNRSHITDQSAKPRMRGGTHHILPLHSSTSADALHHNNASALLLDHGGDCVFQNSLHTCHDLIKVSMRLILRYLIPYKCGRLCGEAGYHKIRCSKL